MTLERWEFRNPESVLEQKQQREINRKAGAERVCAGCVHKQVLIVGKETFKACAIGRGNPTIYCNYHQKEASE